MLSCDARHPESWRWAPRYRRTCNRPQKHLHVNHVWFMAHLSEEQLETRCSEFFVCRPTLTVRSCSGDESVWRSSCEGASEWVRGLPGEHCVWRDWCNNRWVNAGFPPHTAATLHVFGYTYSWGDLRGIPPWLAFGAHTMLHGCWLFFTMIGHDHGRYIIG